MPTTFDGSFLKDSFEEAFQIQIEDLDLNQLWFLVKFAKHVRQRCRSNAAFNNFMNRNFPHAKFEEVEKFDFHGNPYRGLKISIGEEYSYTSRGPEFEEIT